MNNPIICFNGNKYWINEKGHFHREDGPAREWFNGTKEWWIDGKLHRIDGPAYEGADGTKSWYINGQRHRLDGPAIEWSDGHKKWWANNFIIQENKYLLKIMVNHE